MDSVNKLVWLKEMSALASAIHFYSIIFGIYSYMELLSWTNAKNLYSHSDVLSLTKTSSGNTDIKKFIALPPFLVSIF